MEGRQVYIDPETSPGSGGAAEHTEPLVAKARETMRPNEGEASTVTVVVRVRPPLPHEAPYGHCARVEAGCRVLLTTSAPEPVDGGRRRGHQASQVQRRVRAVECEFDQVLDMDATQEDMWRAVSPAVEKALSGFNATLFTYGMTGSGKTYTMLGPDLMSSAFQGATVPSTSEFRSSPHRGLVPRVLQRLLEARAPGSLATLSYLQIYQERCYDLLQPAVSARPLKVREEAGRNASAGSTVYTEGLTEVALDSVERGLECLLYGFSNIAFRSTAYNEQSSRSHSVLTITLRQPVASEPGKFRESKVRLVDLAGNERWDTLGPEMTQLHVRELTAINRSLHVLGSCVQALGHMRKDGQPAALHVPYRDSALTMILRDSLSGNSFMAMVCTICSCSFYQVQTLCTLRFADRAKRVKMRARVCEGGDPIVLQQAQAEVAYLRALVASGASNEGDRLQQAVEQLQRQKNSLEGENRNLRQQLAMASAKQEVALSASGAVLTGARVAAPRLRRACSEPALSAASDLWDGTLRAAPSFAGQSRGTSQQAVTSSLDGRLRGRSLGSQVASLIRSDVLRRKSREQVAVLEHPQEPTRPSSPPRRAGRSVPESSEAVQLRPLPGLPTLGGGPGYLGESISAQAPLQPLVLPLPVPTVPAAARPLERRPSSAARSLSSRPSRPASARSVRGSEQIPTPAVSANVPDVCCPKGHELLALGSMLHPLPAAAAVAYSDWNCDAPNCAAGSARTPKLGRFHCTTCQHDICQRCHEALKPGNESEISNPLYTSRPPARPLVDRRAQLGAGGAYGAPSVNQKRPPAVRGGVGPESFGLERRTQQHVQELFLQKLGGTASSAGLATTSSSAFTRTTATPSGLPDFGLKLPEMHRSALGHGHVSAASLQSGGSSPSGDGVSTPRSRKRQITTPRMDFENPLPVLGETRGEASPMRHPPVMPTVAMPSPRQMPGTSQRPVMGTQPSHFLVKAGQAPFTRTDGEVLAGSESGPAAQRQSSLHAKFGTNGSCVGSLLRDLDARKQSGSE